MDPDVVEPVEAAVVRDGLAGPQRAEDRHALDHPADALRHGHTHRGELRRPLRPAGRRGPAAGVRPAAEARDQERAAVA